MSLDWYLDEIEDYKNRCYEEIEEGERKQLRLKPKVQALIWATMSIGMSKITADNAEEFATRCYMNETVYGISCYKLGEDGKMQKDRISYDDVVEFTGLITNASRMTQAQFHKKIINSLRRDGEYVTNIEKQRLEEKAA